MADDELVQRRARSDEDPDRSRAAPGASELLPRRRDRPRVTDKHRALQAADVDAELERVGAHHARDLSLPQAGLDLAPVKREIAGAISAHPFRRVEPRGQVLAQVAEHHLDLEAAPAEDYGLHAVADPWGRDSAGFEQGAAPDPELAAEQGRVVEDEPPLSAWGTAAVHEGNVVLLEQPARELPRVADRRRRADERRRRAIEGAHALQPADHVGHLAAEKTAIGVQLVDDDEIEAREQSPPPRVMRQHPGVEHVWVGHDDVAAFADRGPASGWGVAVVGVHAHVDGQAGLERPQLGQLILRQGFGRKHVQRAPLRVLEQALQDGQVVAKRLAAGGGSNHDQVVPVFQSCIGLGLVRVQSLDAATAQCGGKLGANICR